MAVLALGFVGAAIGGGIGGTVLGISAATIGGMIGSSIGGMIDRMIFAGSSKAEGPRLHDLSVHTSAYGQPIPRFYGPENRTSVNVIWAGPLVETRHVTEQGGKGGKGGGSSVTTFTYSRSIAVLIGEGLINKLKKVRASGKVIFDLAEALVAPDAPTSLVGMVADKTNGTHEIFDTIRFYQGNDTQQIDPTIEADLGVGEAQAFIHSAYAVITDLQLGDFGNGLPNLEFDIEAQTSITLGDIARDLAVRSGITDLEATDATQPVRGFMLSRPGQTYGAFDPLQLAYNADLAEQAGQLRMIPRGRGMVATIDLAEMGAAEPKDARPEPLVHMRLPTLTLPRSVAISFRDPAIDYDLNTQRASRRQGGSLNELSHDLPLTLTATEGRAVADRVLWEVWAARRPVAFAVSDRFLFLRAGDIVGIKTPGAVLPYKIARMLRGANGIIKCEARYDDQLAYRSTAPGVAGAPRSNTLSISPITKLVLVDGPAFNDADDNAGFDWAVTANNTKWRSASVERSIEDPPVNYEEVGSTNIRAVIGTVASAVPSGPTDFWDRGNVITVVLTHDDDELESLSEFEVLGRRNLFWLGAAPPGTGGEVGQFKRATLVAPRTYELRDLLRGRGGTEPYVGLHGANETFVLVDPTAMFVADYGVEDWDKERTYRAVSAHADPTLAATQVFTNTGEKKRPLSPVHVAGTRDGSNNLTATAIRRTRLQAPGLGYGNVPLGEAYQLYEWDFYNGATIVRTVTTFTPTVSYTAAQQTSDGLTPGNLVSLKVYQISDERGRGHAATALV